MKQCVCFPDHRIIGKELLAFDLTVTNTTESPSRLTPSATSYQLLSSSKKGRDHLDNDDKPGRHTCSRSLHLSLSVLGGDCVLEAVDML